MNAALKICQERYDAQLPPEVSESDEVTDWLEHSAERLVCGVDIKWKRRYIKGLDGRKVHVRSPHSALNTLLQSAGALVCKAWVVELERLLMEEHGLSHGWDGDFCFMAWVHDEVQIAARNPEIAEIVRNAGQQAMRNVQELFAFRCQLDTDYKIGGTWKDCH